MISLRLWTHAKEGTPEVVHYMEAGGKAKEVEELKLDPKINDDNLVILIEGRTTF